MNLATFLISAVFGPFALLMALLMIFDKKRMLKTVEKLFKNNELIFVLAILNLLLGLLLVNIHNIWDGNFEIVVTVVSWMTLLKGVYLLFVDEKRIKEMAKMYKKSSFYFLSTTLTLLIGGYLTYVAYFMSNF